MSFWLPSDISMIDPFDLIPSFIIKVIIMLNDFFNLFF